MQRRWMIAMMLVLAVVLAGCDTGDSASDATSAQNLQPNFTGYDVYETGNIVETVTNVSGVAAAGTGNVPLALAIERAGAIITCLENRGAVSARGYLETTPSSGLLPQGGFSLVVNEDRVARNLLSCAAEAPASAQSVVPEVCANSGQFTFSGEEFTFLYVGTGTEFCAAISQHFSNLGS